MITNDRGNFIHGRKRSAYDYTIISAQRKGATCEASRNVNDRRRLRMISLSSGDVRQEKHAERKKAAEATFLHRLLQRALRR